MDTSLLYRVLEGDALAAEEFGEADTCAVVDWRDGPRGIVAALAAFLPDGYLAVGRVDASGCQILVHGKPPVTVPLPANATQEHLLAGIDRALAPAYGLRQFRPVDGDGYAIYVAPGPVWSEIERAYPQATERFFLSAERLAAYWSKGYWRRLFGKP